MAKPPTPHKNVSITGSVLSARVDKVMRKIYEGKGLKPGEVKILKDHEERRANEIFWQRSEAVSQKDLRLILGGMPRSTLVRLETLGLPRNVDEKKTYALARTIPWLLNHYRHPDESSRTLSRKEEQEIIKLQHSNAILSTRRQQLSGELVSVVDVTSLLNRAGDVARERIQRHIRRNPKQAKAVKRIVDEALADVLKEFDND